MALDKNDKQFIQRLLDLKFKEEREFSSRARENQTAAILASVVGIERMNAVENRVQDLEDDLATLKATIKTATNS